MPDGQAAANIDEDLEEIYRRRRVPMIQEQLLDRNPLLVPASESEVTAQWLRSVLPSSFPGEAFEAVEFERIGADYGLASRIARFRWRSGGTTQSVVVKLWSIDGPAGTREVLFYREFGDAAGAHVPACFHAAVDPDRERGVLVLEHLGAVIQGDYLEQLGLERARCVASALARLHATWLQSVKLQKATWLPSVSWWERDGSWFEPRRTLFLERFGQRIEGLGLSLLKQIERAPALANRRMAEAPITLLHADFHLDNILFKVEGDPVILDWARCAKGPLALDLAELLFEMSHPGDFDQLLGAYLSAFEQQDGEAPDPTAVQRQLGGALLRKFAASTCGVARWQAKSPREAAMIDTSIRRALRSVEFWAKRDPDLFEFL